MTPEEQIRALTEALGWLTHQPQQSPGPCMAGNCAMHPDAAVHHTPERVLGSTPIGAHTPHPLYDAATLVATTINAVAKERHTGWGAYGPAADAVVLDLVAAGYLVGPGEGTVDERARRMVLDLQAEVVNRGKGIARTEAKIAGLEEFRTKFLGIKFALQDNFAAKTEAAQVAGEPEPTYTGEQILKWLNSMLDRSDKAAGRAETKSLAQKRAEESATAEPVGLFETHRESA